ncbi:hypothetical protein [Limibacterium fermenti]|uniref:hypothetical protein n=1 Tax=Limibacterium fermenti TaxID=3229863 RepID=UPI003A5EFAC0
MNVKIHFWCIADTQHGNFFTGHKTPYRQPPILFYPETELNALAPEQIKKVNGFGTADK